MSFGERQSSARLERVAITLAADRPRPRPSKTPALQRWATGGRSGIGSSTPSGLMTRLEKPSEARDSDVGVRCRASWASWSARTVSKGRGADPRSSAVVSEAGSTSPRSSCRGTRREAGAAAAVAGRHHEVPTQRATAARRPKRLRMLSLCGRGRTIEAWLSLHARFRQRWQLCLRVGSLRAANAEKLGTRGRAARTTHRSSRASAEGVSTRRPLASMKARVPSVADRCLRRDSKHFERRTFEATAGGPLAGAVARLAARPRPLRKAAWGRATRTRVYPRSS